MYNHVSCLCELFFKRWYNIKLFWRHFVSNQERNWCAYALKYEYVVSIVSYYNLSIFVPSYEMCTKQIYSIIYAFWIFLQKNEIDTNDKWHYCVVIVINQDRINSSMPTQEATVDLWHVNYIQNGSVRSTNL